MRDCRVCSAYVHLSERVASIHASIQTKLHAAFLGVVGLLVTLGAVGLGALQRADERTAEPLLDGKEVELVRNVEPELPVLCTD